MKFVILFALLSLVAANVVKRQAPRPSDDLPSGVKLTAAPLQYKPHIFPPKEKHQAPRLGHDLPSGVELTTAPIHHRPKPIPTHIKEKRQAPRLGYDLPSGVELIAGPIKGSFSCDNRIYGYYADVETNCKIFHVCAPILDHLGAQVSVGHYSFGCGNLTVFDQATLVCIHDADLEDCKTAPSLYDAVNTRFGITDRPKRQLHEPYLPPISPPQN